MGPVALPEYDGGLKLAVTPEGRPVATNVTRPVDPLERVRCSATVGEEDGDTTTEGTNASFVTANAGAAAGSLA